MKHIGVWMIDFIKLAQIANIEKSDDEYLKFAFYHHFEVSDSDKMRIIFDYDIEDSSNEVSAFNEMCDKCDKLGIIAKIW